MNYYERIQRAIDYLEKEVEGNPQLEEAAKSAFMSQSNFYRIFFAITGYPVKEYLRRRRISLAAVQIKHGKGKIIDIALQYGYDSPDSFTRAFKALTGCTPHRYSTYEKEYHFERMDIMEQHFEAQDREHAEKYPDIKVLKELAPMRVASFRYYGRNPEKEAFHSLQDWLRKVKSQGFPENYRIFGYNSPEPAEGQIEFGYELCITIPEGYPIEEDKIVVKTLEGGLYAITSVSRTESSELGDEIIQGWQRFFKWLEGSKYTYGGRQYLEEHLGFDDALNHIGGVDLYMPIAPRATLAAVEEEEHIASFAMVSFSAKGHNAESRARKQLFDWIRKENISMRDENTRIFANYDYMKIGKPEFIYTIYMSVPDHMEVANSELQISTFPGGLFLKRSVKYYDNARSWFDFIGQIEQSQKYTYGPQPFMEEYLISEPEINADTEVIQHMPIVYK